MIKIVAAGPALPASMSKMMTEIANDPKRSKALLMRAGIITKTGKLTKEYA